MGRNDLAKPVEVNAFERDRIKAFSHGFPRYTTSHERAEVPVSLSSSRGRGGQQLGPQAVRCFT